jgi:hypothetical protein
MILALHLVLPLELAGDDNSLGCSLGSMHFVPSHDDTPKELMQVARRVGLAAVSAEALTARGCS